MSNTISCVAKRDPLDMVWVAGSGRLANARWRLFREVGSPPVTLRQFLLTATVVFPGTETDTNPAPLPRRGAFLRDQRQHCRADDRRCHAAPSGQPVRRAAECDGRGVDQDAARPRPCVDRARPKSGGRDDVQTIAQHPLSVSAGLGCRLLAFALAERQPSYVLGARRDVLFMAAQIVNHFKPRRINAQFKPTFLLRLFRAHGQLRSVVFDRNVRRRGSGVNRPQSSYPESPDEAYLTGMYGVTYYLSTNNTGAAMKSLLSLAAAAALFLSFAAPARATEWTQMRDVGPWTISATEGLCQGAAKFRNGTQLGFFFNADGEFWLSLSSPEWRIPNGEYEIASQVDRSERSTHKAKVIDNWIVWQIATTEHNNNLLSFGRVLYLTVGTRQYQYELVRSEAMLKALGECIAPQMASANPFRGGAPAAKAPSDNPFAETRSNPYRRM